MNNDFLCIHSAIKVGGGVLMLPQSPTNFYVELRTEQKNGFFFLALFCDNASELGSIIFLKNITATKYKSVFSFSAVFLVFFFWNISWAFSLVENNCFLIGRKQLLSHSSKIITTIDCQNEPENFLSFRAKLTFKLYIVLYAENVSTCHYWKYVQVKSNSTNSKNAFFYGGIHLVQAPGATRGRGSQTKRHSL